MQAVDGGTATTTDRLARELSRVTGIFEHFLNDIETGHGCSDIPTGLRMMAKIARLELDGATIGR